MFEGTFSTLCFMVNYFSDKACSIDTNFIGILSEGLWPVYYRRFPKGEIEMVKELNAQICLSRHLSLFIEKRDYHERI